MSFTSMIMAAPTVLPPVSSEPGLDKINKSTITEVQVPSEDFDFDPVALKAKYLAEREKRIRANPNAVDQYQAIEGSLAHYLDDPWLGQDEKREPVTISTDVVVIGAGYGGELTAYQLKQHGVEDFLIIEKGADFGGVW
jgi:NADPH-dependent 2,4-dienoyl-CoA reductase/sulfur reductase-like enzyme